MNRFLKVVDRFNSSVVSAYVTPGTTDISAPTNAYNIGYDLILDVYLSDRRALSAIAA